MSDPRVPPPRRPAPDALRARVLAELGRAPARRVRPRQVLLPVAAAAAAAALVLGLSTLGGPSAVEPVATASPAPPTTSAPAPTPSASAPAAPVSLDVRLMTAAEIAADTKTCRTPSADDTDPPPRSGKPRALYAAVQQVAGLEGPSSRTLRMLISEDDAGLWICADGSDSAWSADGLDRPALSAAVPAAEVDSVGGSGSSCGDADAESTGTALFAVGEQVASGRVRVVKDGVAGRWSTSTPSRGLVHFVYHLRGEDTQAADAAAQFQFLGADGEPVVVRSSGPRGLRTTTTASQQFSTCADLEERLTPVAEERPANDRAGVATCQKMLRTWARDDGTTLGSGWTSRLVVSTPDEWGAVLGDGRRHVGCSLFPTREISPIGDDADPVDEDAFRFALNPIASPEGESLWAAGRVPEDVTAIRYRLPGHQDVVASIGTDGYWMMKFHTDGSIGASDDVESWDPVVVTVTRASGTTTYTLPFGIDTMCHQVSHGC